MMAYIFRAADFSELRKSSKSVAREHSISRNIVKECDRVKIWKRGGGLDPSQIFEDSSAFASPHSARPPEDPPVYRVQSRTVAKSSTI